MQVWYGAVLFRKHWLFVPLYHEMTSAFSLENFKYLHISKFSYPNISSKWLKNPSKTCWPLRLLFRSADSAVSNPTTTWHLLSLTAESRDHIHISLVNRSLYTVNLMKFLGPKAAFELTNNFPRSKHLDRVYGSVFVRGKFWNKSDVPIFGDCKRDSNNDVLSGYNFPLLILQKNSSTNI